MNPDNNQDAAPAGLNKCTLIAGVNGTGKTQLTINLAKKMNVMQQTIVFNFSNEKKYGLNGFVPILLKDPQPTKAGLYVYNITPEMYAAAEKNLIKSIFLKMCSLENCLVILDDIKMVTAANITILFKSFLVSFRQRNTNLIFIYHDLNDIQKSVISHSRNLILFKTNNFLSTDKITNKDLIKKIETSFNNVQKEYENGNIYYNEFIEL